MNEIGDIRFFFSGLKCNSGDVRYNITLNHSACGISLFRAVDLVMLQVKQGLGQVVFGWVTAGERMPYGHHVTKR